MCHPFCAIIFKHMGSCSVQNVQQSLEGRGSITEQVTVWRLSGQQHVFFLFFFLIGMSGCSVLFCSVCGKKGLSVLSRDCLLGCASKNSGNKSRDGEGGCNIRVIITRAPMASRRVSWGQRYPLPRVKEWAGPGKARSRCVGGWAYSKGAAAAVFNREPRRAPDRDGAERFQHQRDWTATRSLPHTHLTNFLTQHHGSHLDPVRCEAQKC